MNIYYEIIKINQKRPELYHYISKDIIYEKIEYILQKNNKNFYLHLLI